MPRGKKKTTETSVNSYTHGGKKRKNNPPVGLVSTTTDKLNGQTKYEHDPYIDPSLSWAGKKEGMSFEVQNVSLHIHERIDPSRIVKSFMKPQTHKEQLSLFDEPENNPPLIKAIDFYHHEQAWTNRLIAGDSLLVMNSLLVKEGMAGKVQTFYFDPPYGITYNSNFQPFVNKRDVKDGNDADIPAEPEMIQAFRDTWELDIHSYLTYLRDRLPLARELLHESGSSFVQISDENVHHVREICDEVFGKENFVSLITFRTAISTNTIFGISDYLVWYSKNKKMMKNKNLFIDKPEHKSEATFTYKDEHGSFKPTDEIWGTNKNALFDDFKLGAHGYKPPRGKGYKWGKDGMDRLLENNRLVVIGNTIYGKKLPSDFPMMNLTNLSAVSG